AGGEGVQAHEADDLGRAVDVGLELALAEVGHRLEVTPHRAEERSGEGGAETGASGRGGERVHDQAGAEATLERVLDVALQRVERLPARSDVETGLLGRAVDDLVGDA